MTPTSLVNQTEYKEFKDGLRQIGQEPQHPGTSLIKLVSLTKEQQQTCQKLYREGKLKRGWTYLRENGARELWSGSDTWETIVSLACGGGIGVFVGGVRNYRRYAGGANGGILHLIEEDGETVKIWRGPETAQIMKRSILGVAAFVVVCVVGKKLWDNTARIRASDKYQEWKREHIEAVEEENIRRFISHDIFLRNFICPLTNKLPIAPVRVYAVASGLADRRIFEKKSLLDEIKRHPERFPFTRPEQPNYYVEYDFATANSVIDRLNHLALQAIPAQLGELHCYIGTETSNIVLSYIPEQLGDNNRLYKEIQKTRRVILREKEAQICEEGFDTVGSRAPQNGQLVALTPDQRNARRAEQGRSERWIEVYLPNYYYNLLTKNPTTKLIRSAEFDSAFHTQVK